MRPSPLLLVISLCLVAAPAHAADPAAAPAYAAQPPAVPAYADAPPAAPGAFDLRTTLAAPSPRPCTGRLDPTTRLCDVAFQLTTSAAVILLDSLLPVERRLTPFSGLAPPPGTRRDAPPGTWVTGFSSDPTFVGLGKFQLRDAR